MTIRDPFVWVVTMVMLGCVRMPVGQRVVGVKVKCTACPIPQLVDLNDTAVYDILMTSFIANGRDGYAVINDNKIKHHLLDNVDTDVFIEYAKRASPLITGMEGRITFREPAPSPSPCGINDVAHPTAGLLTATAALFLLTLCRDRGYGVEFAFVLLL